MIISTNKMANITDFELLMRKTNDWLNSDASSRTNYYLGRNAQLLEDDVIMSLIVNAADTPFANTIVKVSGQKFPDIVAGMYFGVEVKSSKDDKWATIGGSVNESTRVEDVERIFLTFGRLIDPVEFRTRPYEDCLSGVAVTHYPRYKIDMNLSAGQTIFEQMNTTYDELRLSNDPVGKIVGYYKSQMKDGERLWWASSEDEECVLEVDELKIRLASTLSLAERQHITAAGMALFPEVFGKSSKKYAQFVLWLAAERQIVSPSTRDFFSAGGQFSIVTERATFDKMPHVVFKVNAAKEAIRNIINSEVELTLRKTWRVDKVDSDRVGQWINEVARHADSFGAFSSSEVLSAVFGRA